MVVESLLSLLDLECVVCLQSLVRFCCIPSFFSRFGVLRCSTMGE